MLRDRGDRTSAKTIPGTRQLHCISPVSAQVIQSRNRSCYCTYCVQGNFEECENQGYVDDWVRWSFKTGKVLPERTGVQPVRNLKTSVQSSSDYSGPRTRSRKEVPDMSD